MKTLLENFNRQKPCIKDELYFDRDRRVFYSAFTGVKTFQLFDDRPKKDPRLAKIFSVNGAMPVNYVMRLEQLNDSGAGVFMCINETNGKGRKADDVVRVRACFADLDGVPVDPVWEYDPSMVVESSPGKYHAYWLSDNIPLEGFKQLQECISEKFGSDTKVKDLPRVLRVPGFNHHKGKPFTSRIIFFTGVKYDFGLLTEMFPPKPKKQWSAPKYQTNTGSTDQNIEFKGQYGTYNGNRNNHVAQRIGGMLKRRLTWPEIEQEAFKEATACNPPLSDAETRAILKSMRRYS